MRSFGVEISHAAVICRDIVLLARMFDGLADTLPESVRITDQQPVSAGPPQVFGVFETSTQWKGDALFPPVRNVVPAAVKEIFRAGPVNDGFAVNRRLVVAFEE